MSIVIVTNRIRNHKFTLFYIKNQTSDTSEIFEIVEVHGKYIKNFFRAKIRLLVREL